MPDSLRTNLGDLALVVINGDGSLTILSGSVRINSSGTMYCGALSSLPATIAVGASGAPMGFATATPEPEPEAPDTGGAAPAFGIALWALLLGAAVVAIGFAAMRLRVTRRRTR